MDVRTPLTSVAMSILDSVLGGEEAEGAGSALVVETLAVAQAAFNGPGARIPARTTDAPMAREDDAESPLPCH